MRRPSIACRRAAQSLQSTSPQHIWISDDLLSRVAYRFFRSTCPHQKRYGSHVPGPLEARRRASKRRMTAQANIYPQGGFPPPFSFGALFGFRSNPQPSWRYEPPSLPHNLEPLDLSIGHERLSSEPSSPSLPSVFEHPHPIPGSQTEEQSLSKNSIQDTEKSVKGVEHAQKGLVDGATGILSTGMEAHGASNINSCFERFQQQIEPGIALPREAQIKSIKEALRSCQPTADTTGNFSLLVLRHLREKGWTPAVIGTCLSKSYVLLPHPYTVHGLSFLEHLDEMVITSSTRVKNIGRLYQRLAEMLRSASKSTSSSEDRSLCLIIRGLWDVTCSQGPNIEASRLELLFALQEKISDIRVRRCLGPILADSAKSAHQVVALIATCNRKSELLPVAERVLDYIPHTLLHFWISTVPLKLVSKDRRRTQTMTESTEHVNHLKTWLKLVSSLDIESRHTFKSPFFDITFEVFAENTLSHRKIQLPLQALLHALNYKLTRHSSLLAAPSKKVDTFFQSFDLYPDDQIDLHMSVNEMLVRLMLRMQEKSVPNHGVIELMIPLICQYRGLSSVLDLLKRMEKQGVILSDTAYLKQFLAQLLDQVRNSSDTSRNVQRQHEAFKLHVCQQIQALLLRLGSRIQISGKELDALQALRQFQHILDQAQDAHMLPLSYRDMTADIPMGKRAELIHQIANQYSLNLARSYLENSRSADYLYRYLRRYELPMGPLFTKALVRIYVIRPLSENRFVPSRRLSWVCQMVAEIEGEEAAKKIEHTFYRWRGDIIQHAKRTLITHGGTGDARVNTMKRLGMI